MSNSKNNLLFWDMATITWAHHSLISQNRNGALWGTIATVILAVIFSGFQVVEYYQSTFTLSDGIFGSTFFFATGFLLAQYIYLDLIHKPYLNKFTGQCVATDEGLKNKLLISLPTSKGIDPFYLNREFLEWLVGFTDAEGNFNINTVGLNNNSFKSVQFTFQIGLHEDDVEVLELIMNTLNCGHISRSKNKVNYFVNDITSLLYIIMPIFSEINLNSSKYHHFELFKKAILLTKNKQHLSDEGKLEIIQIKTKMQSMTNKWVPDSINAKINITKYWLAGFIDGDGSFSTNKYVPRFKLENHIKELELYNKIKAFLGVGNLIFTTPRINRENSNPTIVLEVNKIKDLLDVLIPLMYKDNFVLLKTLKSKDFLLWLNIVDMYYKGYHTMLEGKYIIDAIKLNINKYRLTTNISIANNKYLFNLEIAKLLSELYTLASPYEIIEGVRYYRDTNGGTAPAVPPLVSESVSIVAIDSDNKNYYYSSMSECSKSLNISRSTIKKCLISGKSFNGYVFVLK